MRQNNTQWIFFDLDDTLIPSTQAYDYAYRKLKLTNDKFFKEAKEYIKNLLPNDHTSSHNRFLYFKKYLSLKKNMSPKSILDLNTKYEKYLTQYLKKNLPKDLYKTLSSLSKHYNLALVTNENCRTQVLKINCFDPKGKLFKYVVTSEEVGFEKPNMQIFNETLKLCKTSPQNVLFIGDSLKNDYIPAEKLGMKAYLFTAFKKELAGNSKKINEVTSLKELLLLLKKN